MKRFAEPTSRAEDLYEGDYIQTMNKTPSSMLQAVRDLMRNPVLTREWRTDVYLPVLQDGPDTWVMFNPWWNWAVVESKDFELGKKLRSAVESADWKVISADEL